MTPLNPPIIIPAGGGAFSFNAAVARTIGPQTAFWVWARIKNPNGTYTDPTVGPVQINPPVGVNVSRVRTQNVPNTWASGFYYYIGYANALYGYPPVDADSFSWTKSADLDGAPFVWDASCTGEPFPYVVIETSSPISYTLITINPNPFNPTTAISYQLSAFSHVSLQVYDVSGRVVAALVDGWRQAGSHKVTFDGSGLASGVYLYRLEAGGQDAAGKMMLLK
jgi:hypothetical protein